LRISSMPSIVLTASSSTFVTPVSISSTLAPLSVVVTTTIGKSTFGKRSRPRRTYEKRPRTTSDAISMLANTGRRMKTSAKRIGRRSGPGGHVGADDHLGTVGELREPARRHLLALPDALRDLHPAVAQVDAQADLPLARHSVLDDEELGHAGEGGE